MGGLEEEAGLEWEFSGTGELLRRNQSAEELAGVVKEVEAGNWSQGHSQLLVNLMSARKQMYFSWYSVCLVCMKAWIPSLPPHK